MRFARLRAAILAIALVAPWSGAGGAVCLGTLPWLAAECPDLCCDSAAACCDDHPAQPLPERLPDCCVTAPDLWYHTDGTVIALLPPAPVHDLLATTLASRDPHGSAPALHFLRGPAPIPLTGVIVLQV